MESQAVLGVYNIKEEYLQILKEAFFDSNMLLQNIKDLQSLNNLDIIDSPDILLISFNETNVKHFEFLREINDKKRMALVTLGNESITNKETFHMLYETPIDIIMANSMISTIAMTMRKNKISYIKKWIM